MENNTSTVRNRAASLLFEYSIKYLMEYSSTLKGISSSYKKSTYYKVGSRWR